MSIERIFYCDWRECEVHMRTADVRPRGAFFTITESAGRSLHFCSWDCILKHAGEKPASEMVSLRPEEDEVMSTFYMSFADADLPTGEQFLGALFIEADDLQTAITASHLLGLNPGGEIQIVEIPPDHASDIPDGWRGRLLDRADIDVVRPGDGRGVQLSRAAGC